MVVDIVDVGGSHAGITESRMHASGSPFMSGRRDGQMKGVARRSIPKNFRVDACPPLSGGVQLFKDEETAPLAEDKPVKVKIEQGDRPSAARRFA